MIVTYSAVRDRNIESNSEGFPIRFYVLAIISYNNVRGSAERSETAATFCVTGLDFSSENPIGDRAFDTSRADNADAWAT